MGSGFSKVIPSLGPDFPSEPRFLHLTNFGNVCYCNALMQCCANSDALMSYMLELENSGAMRGVNRNTLSELHRLLRRLFTKSNRREFSADCRRLLRCVRKETDQFKLKQQHDSHEFFLFLVNSLQEVAKTMPIPPFAPFFEGRKCITFECQKCETSEVQHEAFCGHYIALDGLSTDKTTSVQEQIDESMKSCTLIGDEMRMCDHCHKKRRATMQCSFEGLPPIFVVQLQRFRYDRASGGVVKVPTHIDAEERIRLTLDENKVIYDLKGFIVHRGKHIDRGHYYAVVKVCGRWILANDSRLSEMPNAEDFLSRGGLGSKHCQVPYLLFYERRE